MSILGLILITAACGSSAMTDRLEATYAMADFEIEGAERSRTEFNGSTVVDGPRGISQRFTPLNGVEPEEVYEAAVAAAEADGWELRPSSLGGVVGDRRVAGAESCDALTINDPFDGKVLVRLQESTCAPGL